MTRVRRTLALLVIVATIAAGAMTASLRESPGARSAAAFVMSSVTLVVATGFALRILLVLDRRR